MKKLYWRPQRVSLRILGLVAAVAVLGLAAVETFRVRVREPYYAEKIKAARLARNAFDVLKEERLRLRLPIEAEADPAGSGLIGVLLSPVTTNPGHLPAKQTSINPNFAAVVVHLLKKAGAEPGDTVAVGLSGSFPAINVAVLSAVSVLGLKPVIVSSVGSSQWGANMPEFMWPDMEAALARRRVLPFRSAALSRGGIEDRASGISRQGRQLLDEAMARSGLPVLDVKSYDESVVRRMALYHEQAGEAEIRAYVNVGGGTTSVGTRIGKQMFNPGLNRKVPHGVVDNDLDSVMTRFAVDGVPVIHLTRIDQLAERYGLPLQPVIVPAAGEGTIYLREVHNPWLAGGVLVVLVGLLFFLVRLDWGYRLLATGRSDSRPIHPQKMV